MGGPWLERVRRTSARLLQEKKNEIKTPSVAAVTDGRSNDEQMQCSCSDGGGRESEWQQQQQQQQAATASRRVQPCGILYFRCATFSPVLVVAKVEDAERNSKFLSFGPPWNGKVEK